jgi:hypothetical protein
MEMLLWDIYEISSEEVSLQGVMLRGRIRKLSLEKNINILVENTEDINNGVRLALLTGEGVDPIQEYLESIIPDIQIRLILEAVKNPILSKLKVNQEGRYTL